MATLTESLLKAVLDNPNDLDRRLVYADALQDRDDPRGEFIVHHIAGRQEAQTLLKQYGKKWTEFLHPAASRSGLRFVNGFIERVTFKVEHLKMLPAILEREPIHEIRFRDLYNEGSQLVRMPRCTSRITWLDLKHGHVSGKGFTTLMEGQWDRLWRIWAPSNAIGDIGIQALVDASPPSLKSLNFHGTQLRDRSLEHLANWPGFAQIEELNLRGNDLSDDAIALLLSKASSIRWLGLPTVESATLKVLSGKPVKTIESLVVTEAEDTSKLLKQLYGKRFVLAPQYESNFDIHWP